MEQAVRETVQLEEPVSIDVQDDCGHNRVEKRTCTVYSELSHIDKIEKWQGLKSIVTIESEVYGKKTQKTVKEERFYITSHKPDAKHLNRSIRRHWNIENNLHWSLDVQFNEDASRKRKGYEAQNFNILLKIAISMLVKDKTNKISKPRKRMKAALSQKYREELLKF